MELNERIKNAYGEDIETVLKCLKPDMWPYSEEPFKIHMESLQESAEMLHKLERYFDAGFRLEHPNGTGIDMYEAGVLK